MFKSLLLDRSNWDVCLDAGGNIAVCTEPYRTAQDAACAIKLFQGELWFRTDLGIPYFDQILGKNPSAAFLKSEFVAAALTVPGVASAVCFLTAIENRTVAGQVQITDTDGTQSVVSVGQGQGATVFLPG